MRKLLGGPFQVRTISTILAAAAIAVAPAALAVPVAPAAHACTLAEAVDPHSMVSTDVLGYLQPQRSSATGPAARSSTPAPERDAGADPAGPGEASEHGAGAEPAGQAADHRQADRTAHPAQRERPHRCGRGSQERAGGDHRSA